MKIPCFEFSSGPYYQSSSKTITNTLISAIVLVISLTVVVPTLALFFDIPVLIPVVLAILGFGIYALLTRRIYESGYAAIGVLVTFNANLPVIHGRPGVSEFAIFLVDLVLLPLLLIHLYIELRDRQTPFTTVKLPKFSRYSLPWYAFGAVIIAAILSAIRSNGPSTAAPWLFLSEQFRWFLIMALGYLIAKHRSIKLILYPLFAAVTGHMLVSIVQILNGGPLGLPHLGEVTPSVLTVISLGPVSINTGLYNGGFAGESRLLVALIVIVFPVYMYVIYKNKLFYVSIPLFIASVTIVVATNSDAGTVAFIEMIVLATLFFLYKETVVPKELLSGTFFLGFLSGSLGALYSIIQIRSNMEAIASARGVGEGALLPSLSIRLDQYRAAFDIVTDYPVFGLGGRNFALVAHKYRVPPGVSDIHNTYLAYFASLGIPGGIVFSIALIAVIVSIVSEILRTGGEYSRFLAFIGIGFFSFYQLSFWGLLYKTPVVYGVFWLLTGGVIGIIYNQTRQQAR